ncbi:unnamed protein product, partial [Ectocarpus fasciculatus]
LDDVATPPPGDRVEGRDDNIQGMGGGEVSHDVGLGSGVEEAKGEGCAEDPRNIGGTRKGAVGDCQQDGCRTSVDGVGDDGYGGELVIVGARASAAAVHRLERRRTYEQVQDTQTHDSATLLFGGREMDVGESLVHGRGDGDDTSPDGGGLPDPHNNNGRDTSVRQLGREMSHGGGADDPGPEGHAEYPCEGGVHVSGSGSGGSCSHVNGSNSGGHGMESGRTHTVFPSDRRQESGGIQRGYLLRRQGVDTQRRATPRLASEAVLLGGG